MEQSNPKDFFWQNYEKLPESLKEALFSEENFNVVSDICEKNGITDEETKSQITKYVGRVLMGLMPIKDFPIMLELDLNLDTERARNITAEIDSNVFSHLRIDLNKLYADGIADNADLGDNTKKEAETKPAIKKEEIKPIPKVDNKDTYREPIT